MLCISKYFRYKSDVVYGEFCWGVEGGEEGRIVKVFLGILKRRVGVF